MRLIVAVHRSRRQASLRHPNEAIAPVITTMLHVIQLQMAIISVENSSRSSLPLTSDVSGAKLRANSYPSDFHSGDIVI